MSAINGKSFRVILTGATPLLLHADNISWADTMEEWGMDPANKSTSRAGDDRSPAHRWLGCLYTNGGNVAIPSDNIMTMLRQGGARCPTGKKGRTFKSQTQSGILIESAGWDLLVRGKPIPYAPIEKLKDERDFHAHESTAQKLGFSLFIKRAKVGNNKHVRVRPRFENWSLQGVLTVIDEELSLGVLRNILSFAGRFSGLGDWRPSSPKSPGSYGIFTAQIEEVA